jgi:hypothetical protein
MSEWGYILVGSTWSGWMCGFWEGSCTSHKYNAQHGWRGLLLHKNEPFQWVCTYIHTYVVYREWEDLPRGSRAVFSALTVVWDRDGAMGRFCARILRPQLSSQTGGLVPIAPGEIQRVVRGSFCHRGSAQHALRRFNIDAFNTSITIRILFHQLKRTGGFFKAAARIFWAHITCMFPV